MERFTQEQMNVLSQFENNFYTAIHAGYSRNITGEKIHIMEETSGLKCSNRSCTHCVLMFLKTIGEKYFHTKENPIMVQRETEPEGFPPKLPSTIDELAEYMTNMPQESKDMINKLVTDIEQDGKKKRGRPRKERDI